MDVVVVGAGLAGLQCAKSLASRGVKVVLIDRKPSVADGIQTTGIFVRKTWEDFPLPVEQLGPAIREVILFSPKRRAMKLVAPHDEFRVARMPWILVSMLDQCARAGVRWMPSTTFMNADERGVIVKRNGKTEHIDADFVVGADGPRSRVAEAFGLDRNHEFLVGVEDVVASRGGSPSLRCFLDPRLAPGYIGWVADDGGEAHVGVAGYRDRFDPLQSLATLRAEIGCGRAIERRGGLIPVNGILRRIGSRRALLVGDAAGAVSPLTAGGIDGAFRLSTFAADVIVNATIDQYSGDLFRPRFISRQWMRRALATLAQPLFVEAACALLRTPPLRAIAEHVFFARGSFPDCARPEPIGERRLAVLRGQIGD